MENQICPMCDGSEVRALFRDARRDYFRCSCCDLVFVPSAQFLTPEQEKAQYDQHQNSPDDPGYRGFLGRLFHPMRNRLAPGSHGLDFGSGPGPTLSVMFEEIGHRMTIYDPFYAPDPAALEGSYDFITATEVLEHLRHPGRELDRLWALLKSGGVLGIMTKLALDDEAVATWHYKNDPTHICFFSRETFCRLAERWQADLSFPDRDVILLHK